MRFFFSGVWGIAAAIALLAQPAAAQAPRPSVQLERYEPDTIIIDTRARKLYYIEPSGAWLVYPIGVGRAGFAWHGKATVGRMAKWPEWVPPPQMRKRQPDLPHRMAGGYDNPLGARALYLYQGERDTLYRIHGTSEPWTIGQAVSSGCIRMHNGDVIDLYARVQVGTTVVVLP